MNKLLVVYRAILGFFHSPAAAACRQWLVRLAIAGQKLLDCFRVADFLAPLTIRLYLAPVLWMAGTRKLLNFGNTVEWFGNADWGLGLPLPGLLAFLVTSGEVLGGLCLLLGFAVRWVSMPLMATMVMAALTVHWQNGWLAIASGAGLFATDRTVAATEQLQKAKEILQQNGIFAELARYGDLAVLNNGIEFAATYFILLLVLLFMGGGRYVSVDYWLRRRYMP
ncbi:MAG: DoxX family protein [Methylococcaceae bacterium]|nr:MAG: DoxX family protein [Methylococcaceae bacterium]